MVKQEIATREILQATGLRASKTLTNWHQMGLIPPPTVKTHPSGRGRMSYWPSWVVGRCFRIRQLMRQGKELREIKRLLVDEEKNTAKRPNRQYRFSKARKQMDLEAGLANLEELLWHKNIAPLTAALEGVHTLSVRLHAHLRENLDSLLEMIRAGENPVLIIRRETMLILPDFMVSQILASPLQSDSCVVVPIFHEFKAAFESILDVPAAPTVMPAPKVQVVRGKRCREALVRIAGDARYQVVRTKRISNAPEVM